MISGQEYFSKKRTILEHLTSYGVPVTSYGVRDLKSVIEVLLAPLRSLRGKIVFQMRGEINLSKVGTCCQLLNLLVYKLHS